MFLSLILTLFQSITPLPRATRVCTVYSSTTIYDDNIASPNLAPPMPVHFVRKKRKKRKDKKPRTPYRTLPARERKKERKKYNHRVLVLCKVPQVHHTYRKSRCNVNIGKKRVATQILSNPGCRILPSYCTVDATSYSATPPVFQESRTGDPRYTHCMEE